MEKEYIISLKKGVDYDQFWNQIENASEDDGFVPTNTLYPDSYDQYAFSDPEDCAFGGTSAACPVAAGFVACLMGLNRNWTYKEVRAYIQSLDVQSAGKFYYGTESVGATDSNWLDYNSLEGGAAKVGYQDITKITQTTFPIRKANVGGGLTLSNISIQYKDKLDRG